MAPERSGRAHAQPGKGHEEVTTEGERRERRAEGGGDDSGCEGGEWVPGSVEEDGEEREVKRWGRGWGAD